MLKTSARANVELVGPGGAGVAKAIGRRLATGKLAARRPNELIDQSYAIPAALTQGKEHLTIRFQAQPGNFAGGVFGLPLLKP